MRKQIGGWGGIALATIILGSAAGAPGTQTAENVGEWGEWLLELQVINAPGHVVAEAHGAGEPEDIVVVLQHHRSLYHGVA
jgi:hypothetical protein